MLLSLVHTFLFLALIPGLAWPLVQSLALDPLEKFTASAALSLLGVFLVAWAVYVWALPASLFWTLPVLAVVGLAVGHRSFIAAFRDADARTAVASQAIVTAWCMGLLALVLDYSGGGWTGDWWGHWQRARFFLEHGPRDILFNGFDPLTSRPPLVNIILGVFLRLTRDDFAHYQIAMTVLSSLAFLPAALLTRRFGGGYAIATTTVLFMLSPLFAQNATFAWTKLPTAFFILAGLYFFLRVHDVDRPPAAPVLFAVSLAAGLLAHYSAGPYAVVLAVAWLAFGWRRRGEAAWWRSTAVAAVAGGLVLATWFGWCLANYGVKGTLLTNTSVTDNAQGLTAQLQVMALNVRDTLVPHFLRDIDFAFISQQSPWGWWRDWFFQLYQVNFFFAFGSVAWAAILVALARTVRSASFASRAFWLWFVAGNALLGIAVHGGRDTWGLAHICLQPLVLLGLAFLAARWATLGQTWQRLLVAGAALDFSLGIALQFGTENFAFDRWFTPQRSIAEAFLSYSQVTIMNIQAKHQVGWVFFGDLFAAQAPLVAGVLAALLLLALVRAGRRPG
ncbi:MAG: glycosyltransferase family 39 protein [Opitutaceae bacterium]